MEALTSNSRLTINWWTHIIPWFLDLSLKLRPISYTLNIFPPTLLKLSEARPRHTFSSPPSVMEALIRWDMCQMKNSKNSWHGFTQCTWCYKNMYGDCMIGSSAGNVWVQHPQMSSGLIKLGVSIVSRCLQCLSLVRLVYITSASQSIYYDVVYSPVSWAAVGKHSDKTAATRNPLWFSGMLSRQQSVQWVQYLQEKFHKDKVTALFPPGWLYSLCRRKNKEEKAIRETPSRLFSEEDLK